MKNIPIHDFSIDDESSISFEIIKLSKAGSYDTSIPHRHNYYEVFIFEVGGGNHTIDFNAFSIETNSVHFVSPGQVHNVVRNQESKGFVMLFSRSFYTKNHKSLNQFPFLNNNSQNPVLNLAPAQFEIPYHQILTIEKEQKLNEKLSEDLIQAHLNSFLIYCKRYYNELYINNSFSEDSLLFRFKKQIEANYLKLHSVSDYSALLNVSEKQLYAACKNEIGLSPKDLIYERVILEAKRLVLFTEHSFQEIAFFFNYSDASHFAKFFKSKTGHTPGAYRKNGKKYQ
jgi:AraC-like DNA-binding protein